MSGRLKVVMTTEGTYPYCTGGVSTWADILIKQMKDIDFHVIAIMMHPYLTMKFDLPSNVIKMVNVPLWGTEEPTEHIGGLLFSEIFTKKMKPNREIRDTFKDIIGRLVISIYSKHHDLSEIGNDLVRLHDLFKEHDYRNLFRSQWLWTFYYDLFLRIHDGFPEFSLQEFKGTYSIADLFGGISAKNHGLHLQHQGGTIESLNEILQIPRLYDIWSTEIESIDSAEEIEKLINDTREFRSSVFSLLTPMQQWEVMKLNRLILERTFPEACPKMREKGGEPLSVYDVVESLRWLYRFLITLLTPLEKADVYHSSAAAFCGLPCIIAKLKYGSKFLLTEHGIYVREQYLFAAREKIPFRTKEFLMGLIGLISRLNIFFADQISPVCAYNKRWELQFRAPEEKIRVIYNGIDTERFKRIDVERSERPTVVMVARIDPLKDIETYILTCAEVRKKIPTILFKLYGPKVNDEYFKTCEKLAQQLDLHGNFEFAGETSTPELANNEGDIVLLTSISEAFPFSVIEGMACEKLIISSDVGGTREVLEGYGFVVTPKNHVEFAEKVIYALEHPAETAEMGMDARQKIVSGFRTNDMVSNYRETYFSLAGQHAGH